MTLPPLLRRAGWPLIVALPMLLAAAWLALVVAPGWRAEAHTAMVAASTANPVRTVAPAGARATAPLDASAAGGSERAEAAPWPAAARSPQRAEALLALAAARGVRSERLSQRFDAGGRLQLEMSVRAPYPQLRGFIAAALAADSALALDRVQLRRASAADTHLEADLGWTWMHALPSVSPRAPPAAPGVPKADASPRSRPT